MKAEFKNIVEEISKMIQGKKQQIRLALACLFAEGHLLIEDVPGIGKTTLAKAISKCLGLNFKRVQFTNDMLPADILGFSLFNSNDNKFEFHPGPIFTNILLADELNRATPKTQSALLEAMEERQVTIEGKTYGLKKPFFVIATQNPFEYTGAYQLPESQLDRFLMRIDIGYPTRMAEKEILLQGETRSILENLKCNFSSSDNLDMIRQIPKVHASDALLDYVLNILEFTRSSPTFSMGLSPRAGIGLLRAAQAWAFLNDRDFALPEDVQMVMPWVVGHRLRTARDFKQMTRSGLNSMLMKIPVP